MKPLIIILLVVFVILQSCGGEAKNDVPATDTFATVDIEDVKTVLPQVGNVELIESYCMPCHSLRYIETQPKLSYHAWEKTVDKMITIYGAPIRDTVKRRDIINYLYAIKGLKEEH